MRRAHRTAREICPAPTAGSAPPFLSRTEALPRHRFGAYVRSLNQKISEMGIFWTYLVLAVAIVGLCDGGHGPKHQKGPDSVVWDAAVMEEWIRISGKDREMARQVFSRTMGGTAASRDTLEAFFGIQMMKWIEESQSREAKEWVESTAFDVSESGICTDRSLQMFGSWPMECNALAEMYEQLNGPGWTNRSGWEDTANLRRNCCSGSIFGVVCTDSGHISALTLQNNRLSGQLPESIGALQYLRILCAIGIR